MRIDIQDPELEARLRRQVAATGAGSIEEVLRRLLQTQEEEDRWLVDNRDAVNHKIRRGIEQLDGGEGIPGAEAKARLQERKVAWLKRNPR